MRVSNYGFTSNFIYESNLLQNQQNTLQNEASTGLKISLPSDNPAVMAQVLNLQTDNSANTQYQNNITQVQNTASTAFNAINSLESLISQANTIATNASSGTTSPQQLAADATQVTALIQQAVQLGNTKDTSGNYIFGGTNTTAPPFVATTDANGSVTGVTYQGNTTLAQVEIAPGLTVSAQTVGANTTGSGPRGLITDGRSGADLFNHLISLQNNLLSGDKTAITNTDVQNLAKDQDNISFQVGSNSVLQSTLTDSNNNATQQGTNLATQVSNATSADMATTLTKLQQTQTAFEAALESGVQVMQISLVNFLA